MGSNQPSVRPFIVLIFSSGNARAPGNGNSEKGGGGQRG